MIFLKHKSESLSNDFYLKISLIVFGKCKTDEWKQNKKGKKIFKIKLKTKMILKVNFFLTFVFSLLWKGYIIIPILFSI